MRIVAGRAGVPVASVVGAGVLVAVAEASGVIVPPEMGSSEHAANDSRTIKPKKDLLIHFQESGEVIFVLPFITEPGCLIRLPAG